MTVSERDRTYLARMGQLQASSHERAMAEQRGLSLAERLQRSWALFEAFRGNEVLRESEAPAFFAKARARGLYRR